MHPIAWHRVTIVKESGAAWVYKSPHIACESVSRMATVAALSPEIAVLEENTLNSAQQPLMTDTHDQATTAVTPLGPCIQYEDAAEDKENVFQVIFIVNSKTQEEALPNSGSAHADIERQALQGSIDHTSQGKGANQADCHEDQEQLQANTGCKDETANMLEWFRSTFSQIERNGIITLKDFKEKARHSDVCRLKQISELVQ